MKKINIVIGLLIAIILALGIIIFNLKSSDRVNKTFEYRHGDQSGGGLYPDSQKLFKRN